jgi:hypothetical protein
MVAVEFAAAVLAATTGAMRVASSRHAAVQGLTFSPYRVQYTFASVPAPVMSLVCTEIVYVLAEMLEPAVHGRKGASAVTSSEISEPKVHHYVDIISQNTGLWYYSNSLRVITAGARSAQTLT